MRLWSLHPKYLDPAGLVALWREALLAQAVLAGNTKGYKNHPQLERFRMKDNPLGAIGIYLSEIHEEAVRRGHSFNVERILIRDKVAEIAVTDGQIQYEWQHLLAKLTKRNPQWLAQINHKHIIDAHPIFVVRKGSIEQWERIAK